ncbi:MAG: cell wall-binding repeat-containing protein [Coriobacteriia bacterium]|nr:cell wall-binding repeat-containing protein [Coriobacteriia bacterium]
MNRSLYVRIFGVVVAALMLLQGAVVPIAAADVSIAAIPSFNITGGGNGHGIGMSQYGAKGAALAGKDYRWILQYFYTDVTIGAWPARDITVILDPAASSTLSYTRPTWTISSGQPGTTLSINGTVHAAGIYVFTGAGSTISVTGGDLVAPLVLTTGALVKAESGDPALLSVKEGTGLYNFANGKYRGTLELAASGSLLRLYNVLPMDDYLKGVVPREMPSGWPAEALKAQAVAARSYAYADSDDIVYCTTMSQAYQGYGAYNSVGVWVGEMSSTNSAVDATAGLVIKAGSLVAQAFFFSSSGGHTANNEDVWVSGSPLNYTRGVPDTYEYLAGSPYAEWTPRKLSGLEIANALRGLSGVPASPTWVTGIVVERALSGHARYVTFHFSNGAAAKITGDSVRSRLGLRSTRFYFSGFPITRIEGPTRYDTAVQAAMLAFPATAPAVVLASGENFPDALAGSGLAGAADGALLLTQKNALPTVVAGELASLKPQTVYIMGGTSAISSAVESAVKSIVPGATIRRFAGVDRYDTARQAAETARTLAPAEKVFVVSGTSWADAASASALAYQKGYPILLVPKSGANAHTDAFLRAARPATVLIAGGTSVIASTADAYLAGVSGGSVTRLAGADRYQTSAAIARYAGLVTNGETMTYNEIYVATGLGYADALTGGMLAGVRGNPLILTATDTCPLGTVAFLQEKKLSISKLWLLGGTGAVSEQGQKALDAVMMQ